MSLLTPPRSSHRSDKEKENKFSSQPVAGPSTRSVVWAPQNSIHNLATPIKHVLFSSKNRPRETKSILKASSQPILISSEPVANEREATPEPADPLVDLHYLDRPVSQILAEECNTEEGIKELLEGYSDLATRLRASVSEKTDVDASWPLFQPLRKNRDAFVAALERDVRRALVDPVSSDAECVQEKEKRRFSLPSPAKSPTKKKGGFSAEQIKYARDLCTVCHAALKLLSVILSFPALYNIFDHKQLKTLLSAMLAIPLADELPTPNARKTCALVIWLIQVQRLPSEILSPAASRICYALQRGLDGELGKEGKKGSANDGLKAIHDLCEYMPSVFVPEFTPLLPSILSNLLAPTLVLRTQACHALGGFTLASTQIPQCHYHTRISRTIADYLTTPTPSPGKATGASPSKLTEAAIVRTLRTTIKNTEPQQVAQGPVWAVSVLVNFIVLLGSRLCEDPKLSRIITALLGLGMSNGKSSVRALICVAWRQITWTYLQPPLPAEEETETEDDEESRKEVESERERYSKVIMKVVDCGAGVSTLAALMGDESVAGDYSLHQCLEILQKMCLGGNHTCQEAIDTLRHMVNPDNADEVRAFEPKVLLPKKLFSASPGLLTVDFKFLNTAVRPIVEAVPGPKDVRCFTREEMAKPWVFKGIATAWRAALSLMKFDDDAPVPESMVEIWQHALHTVISVHLENEDEEALSVFACTAVKYIKYILEDPSLDLMPKQDTVQAQLLSAVGAASAANQVPGSDDTVPDAPRENLCSNSELRLRVVHKMWAVMQEEFPVESLRDSAEILLRALSTNESVLVYEHTRTMNRAPFEEEEGAREREAWLAMVVDVLLVTGDAAAVKAFFEVDPDAEDNYEKHSNCWSKGYTGAVWRSCVQKWSELSGFWEGAVVLLSVPFTDKHHWGPNSEDFSIWEQFLSYTTGKALDDSINDSSVVLDNISSFVSALQTPGTNPSSILRLLDLLLSALDAPEMRELPINLLQLASQTLSATYPPEPHNKQSAIWMLRTLTTVVEKCPVVFAQQLLESLKESLHAWLADEYEMWTEDELAYDIVPLHSHILFKIQTMPLSLETLEIMDVLMASIFRYRTPAASVEAFTDFWNLTYASLEPPADGWSEAIHCCLVAVGLLPREEPEATETTQSPLLAPALVLQPSSPHTPTSSAPSHASPSLFGSEFLDRVQSPKRPSKAFGGSYPTVFSTPPSPVQVRRARSSARRLPLSPRNLSPPPKRRRLDFGDNRDETTEKENPTTTPVTILDRIAALKSVGKKRRFEDDDNEDDKDYVPAPSAKKLRSKMKGRPASKMKPAPPPDPQSVICVSSDESDDERSVEESLTNSVAFPTEEDDEVQAVAVAPRRARAAERATEAKLEPAASASSLSTPLMKKVDFSTLKPRRSVSNPEPRSVYVSIPERIANLKRNPEPRSVYVSIPERISNLKRKRRESDDEHFDKLSSSDTPLPAPFVPSARPIPRAYSLPSSDDAPEVPNLSSDDDPHTGQVTPHRLISPVPKTKRRAASMSSLLLSKSKSRTPTLDEELFGDDVPGSDDSVSTASGDESDSPTKVAAASRQLRRLRSSDAVLPSKPVRKVTVIDVLDLTV